MCGEGKDELVRLQTEVRQLFEATSFFEHSMRVRLENLERVVKELQAKPASRFQ